MLRFKSRSGSVDMGQKNHFSSVFSRTLSASKLCRGDAFGSQINAKALITTSLDNNKPSKVSNLSSENRITRVMSMQHQSRKLEEEDPTKTKKILSTTKTKKNRTCDQQNEELIIELESLKLLLSSSKDELKTKNQKIASLEMELEKSRQLEVIMIEKDSEFNELKEIEKQMIVLLSENKGKIQELEAEVERKKQVESEADESFLEEIRTLKENLVQAREGEKNALFKAKRVFEEKELLKNELKLAIEAEEKSKNAMEDLSLALKEVAVEANQANGKLGIIQIQLELMKAESKNLKMLLEETKVEAELHKNMANRLRFEAEETFLAWNGKEMGFISCIKRAEEERAISEQENHKLRGEMYKLRGILKQAINERNGAARMARGKKFQVEDFKDKEKEKIDEEREKNETGKILNFNLENLEIMNEADDGDGEVLDEGSQKGEVSRGLFDYIKGEIPKIEVYKRYLEDYDHGESSYDDLDSDRNSDGRMKTMFKQMGDILMIRRSIHIKGPSYSSG